MHGTPFANSRLLMNEVSHTGGNLVEVLLPTCNRFGSLMITLAGVAVQSHAHLRVIIADQSRDAVSESREIQSLCRVIKARGGRVEAHRHIPSRGIAEQRDFLLRQSSGHFVLFLDDDVLTEPWVIE